MTAEAPPPITAALVSVGGSPKPVLHVLTKYRPIHVWYFCSPGSRKTADEIHGQLDWHPTPRFIEVERFEELGPCYRELRRKIPEILKETGVDPKTVLVDYTGGTKTMSSALVLAAIELFDQFSYVGGEQREKRGLGVTVDGREKVLYQDNPWSELAIREVERARDLWAGFQFETACQVLREVSPRVTRPLRFETIANLAEATAARHRLDFKKALELYGKTSKSIPSLFDGQDDYGLIKFCKTSIQVCQACSQNTAHEIVLRELLDNTSRTANQGRYEDAAARLYRAMEMQGQIWLAETTDQIFIDGQCKDLSKLPEPLRTLPYCQPDDRGKIKLSMEQVFKALAVLEHGPSGIIAEDLETVDAAGKTKSRWRSATEKRNKSILAHGVNPIGEKGFTQMKELACEFLGFDLEAETNPIPPLDSRWLMSMNP